MPLLLWTATGLFMASQPIERVRGEHLLADPGPLALAAPLRAPQSGARAITALTLEQRLGGPRWIVRYADGAAQLADPVTGRLLGPLAAADAVQTVRMRYTGTARVAAVKRVAADAPPIDFRRNVAAWHVGMDDGTRFYVDAATGEILARRTSQWRVFDFMWGLHIMDLQTRDDINNGWLIGFAALAVLSLALALVLLPLSSGRRRQLPVAEP